MTPLSPSFDQAQVYAILMAGGRGTRLWPLSRQARPKQFLALQPGGRTLLQEALRRAVQVVGSLKRVLVVSQAQHANLVRQQLPELPAGHLILEPAGRNTAACLALAALHLERRAPQALMAVFPADHLFADEQPWLSAVQAALQFASRSPSLVTIGIPPERPSPSYGYLHLGQPLDPENELPVYAVREFVEKPTPERAMEFIESGEYLWNTGTFAWQTPVFRAAMAEHLPDLHAGLASLASDLDNPDLLGRLYPSLEDISVDYGILEKAANLAVVRAAFRRIDVGSLGSLVEVLPADAQGNAARGEIAARDSRDNIVYTDQGLVGLIGVENMVIVRQGDVLLVCPKERAAEVKELVAALEGLGLERYR